MVDVRVEGADQLEALGRRLKDAGNGELKRELLAGIRKAAKPLPEAVSGSASKTLPQRGGLAAKVAKSKMSIRTRLTGDGAGVRFEAKGIYNLRRMDAGQVRHPVFGRGKWVSQKIPAGWFSQPAEAAAPEIRDAVQKVLREVADKITDN